MLCWTSPDPIRFWPTVSGFGQPVFNNHRACFWADPNQMPMGSAMSTGKTYLHHLPCLLAGGLHPLLAGSDLLLRLLEFALADGAGILHLLLQLFGLLRGLLLHCLGLRQNALLLLCQSQVLFSIVNTCSIITEFIKSWLVLDLSWFINPLTAPACKISRPKNARTLQQTVYFPVLQPIYFHCEALWWKSFHMPVWKRRQKGLRVSKLVLLLVVFKRLLLVIFKWCHGSEGVNFP